MMNYTPLRLRPVATRRLLLEARLNGAGPPRTLLYRGEPIYSVYHLLHTFGNVLQSLIYEYAKLLIRYYNDLTSYYFEWN